MVYTMKPLGCDPQRIKGMSEKLIVSHYENNYGGAVKRLNLITEQLAESRLQHGPQFSRQWPQARGADRHQLHDLARAVFRRARRPERTGADAEAAIARDFGSFDTLAQRIHRHGQGAGWRVGMGVAVVLAARRQTCQPVGCRPLPHARGRHNRSWRSTCTSTPITLTTAPRRRPTSTPSWTPSVGAMPTNCSPR